MNRKLLLCSTAIATLVSGVALAEFKVGGSIVQTSNFGANKGAAGNTQSGERFGTELNLKLSAKNDLNNGMYISYAGNLEVDDMQAGAGIDHEYEIRIGQGNFYIGMGSDAGNNISSTPTLPVVAQNVGSLGLQISQYQPLNYDGFLGLSAAGGAGVSSEANNASHVSANLKVLGGTASYIYTPHNQASLETDDDNDKLSSAAGGKAYSIIYSGSPVANMNVIIGRSVTTGESDISANEYTNDKVGVSYNFGQFAAGVEYQTQKNGTKLTDDKAYNYAVTYKASDTMTLGLAHGVAKAGGTGDTNAPNEKITALSIGYNLGAAAIAVQLVQARDLANVANQDADGVVIRTAYNF